MLIWVVSERLGEEEVAALKKFAISEGNEVMKCGS